MKSLLVTLLVLSTPALAEPTGYWLGRLDVGSAKLRMGFHVEKKPDGALTSTISSLDQSVRDMPTDSTSLAGATLTIEQKKLGLRFSGQVAGDTLEGTFSQGGRDFPLVLKRVAAFEAPKRPQDPKLPLPYRTAEVSVDVNGAKLAGTLTIPTGKGPFPAVVFITGSGPEDRDETVFDHRPFLVIADALTRAGIATARFDDRGTGKSSGTMKGLTTLDFAKDTQTELAWLVTRPEIDKKRVGLIGHSEGGLIAPIVAVESDLPRFLVLLAGLGVPGRELLATQQEKMVRAAGGSDEDVKKAQAAVAVHDDSPWMKTFAALDPQPYLAKVKIPVLAMNGEKDLQVDVSNLDAIRRGLSHDKHVEIVRLPGLNHLFQHCKTGLPTEYASIEETFAPEALDKIRAFVLAR